MAFAMDLVAGDRRAILEVIAAADWAALDDSRRFSAHLALGGELDPDWLDLFSEAVRGVTGLGDPRNFLDARSEVEDPAAEVARNGGVLVHPLSDHRPARYPAELHLLADVDIDDHCTLTQKRFIRHAVFTSATQTPCTSAGMSPSPFSAGSIYRIAYSLPSCST